MNILENINLADYTTLGIGGPARWFAEAKSEDDILQACVYARSRSLPLFILGGGSNLLVADEGFPGLVLHIALRGIEKRSASEDEIFTVAAGEQWDAFVATTVADGCAGVECLSGIPGTVGGTPVQNVGAYGQEVATTIVGARALDRETQQWVELDNAACKFSYRSSVFNTTAKQRYIVSQVTYRLRRGGEPSLAYKDVAQKFQNHPHAPTLIEVREAVREIRHSKGMLLVAGDPDVRSAGSFFKNPVISAEHFAKIAATMQNVPSYPAGEGRVKIPAAWLLEQAGFTKGTVMGSAGISSRHTLALINRGGAKAADILALRDAVGARVAEKFGIALQQEPVYLSSDLSTDGSVAVAD